MIQFALKCDQDHRFDSWFQSAATFEKLHKAGMATCPVCGSSKVEKTLMAPRVQASRKKAATPAPEVTETLPAAPAPAPEAGPLSAPASEVEQALTKLREHVEKNSEYVGMNLASEARDIHNGDAPERAIYGEAKPEEAKQLIEDGVAVSPLPFLPGRKSN